MFRQKHASVVLCLVVMLVTLLPILIATLAISLCSLLGALTLFVKKDKLQNFLIYFVALSAGTMLGSAFLHLLPESVTWLPIKTVSTAVLFSFIGFFMVEKLLCWHHHHDVVNEKHYLGFMNLFGDCFHNFLDGVIIAAAFTTDIRLGVITTLAVAMHEIPQEISDFGVLLHSGFGAKKALLANLFVSFVAVAGGILGLLWIEGANSVVPYITAIAAGGFIYISTADLLPEIRSDEHKNRSLGTFVMFLFGVGIMFLL